MLIIMHDELPSCISACQNKYFKALQYLLYVLAIYTYTSRVSSRIFCLGGGGKIDDCVQI